MRKVGSVRLGSLQINIRPKVAELQRILFFIGYNSNPAIWRDEFVRLGQADGLYPAVAESFVRLVNKALERGVMRGYIPASESISVIRGRIRFQEQITRNYGRPVPIAVEYDDYSMDVAENRTLLLATLRLLGLPDIGIEARRQLTRIRAILDSITVVSKRNARPKITFTKLNMRYHDALRLSAVILDNSSFDQKAGPLAVSGFLFDMWKVYEDFVTGAMSMAMMRHGGKPKVQVDHYMDAASTIRFIPDLVWYDDSGRPIAVVDAKYKVEKLKGYPESDLYQMLAYCSALGIKEGHLVYAKGNGPVSVHVIRSCGIVIHCHSLDLALAPNQLLAEIDSLAAAILRKPSPF